MITTEYFSIDPDEVDSFTYSQEVDDDGDYIDGEQISQPVDASILTITLKGPIATELVAEFRKKIPDCESE